MPSLGQLTLGVEIIDAEERETRGNLNAVVRRVLRSDRGNRAGGGNFMLLEFMLWLHATDRDRSGVVRRYDDLAEIFLTSRNTIRRMIARAEDLELITVEECRYVSGGQRENRYSVNWDYCKHIMRGGEPIGQQPPAQNGQGAAQNGQGAAQNGQGAAQNGQGAAQNGHPYKEHPSTIASTSPELNGSKATPRKRGNGTDHKNRSVVSVQATIVEPIVRQICDRMGYAGDEAQSIWHVAAAVHLGVITEHAAIDAANACKELRRSVGYFRTVVAENAGTDLPGLKLILSGVRVRPSLPSRSPQPAPTVPQASDLLQPLPRQVQPDTHARARELQQQLAKIEADQ